MVSPNRFPRALICTTPHHFSRVFPPAVLDRMLKRVQVERRPYTAEELAVDPSPLREVEFLFTSWNGPVLDANFLAAAPRLRAVFHAAGTVKSIVTPEFWERDIPICNAQADNGLPVADFTYAQIVLALKGYWPLSREMHLARNYPADRQRGPGLSGATIGLISLGGIARALVEKLAPLRPNLLVFDPYADPLEVARLGVRLVGLEEIFARSEIVSCHTPLNNETEGMITEGLLASMQSQATFINTARGRVIAPGALETVLARRPDLTALLDVTEPDPLPPDSPLWKLSNVLISPHIAGSTGRDRALLAEAMIEELDCFLSGEPLRRATNPEAVALAT